MGTVSGDQARLGKETLSLSRRKQESLRAQAEHSNIWFMQKFPDQHIENDVNSDGKMNQQVKALATKPRGLSWIIGTYVVDGEN